MNFTCVNLLKIFILIVIANEVKQSRRIHEIATPPPQFMAGARDDTLTRICKLVQNMHRALIRRLINGIES